MLVSVIIPVKEINKYIIDENLPALKEQTYARVEIIILPDVTNQSDKSLLQKYPNLKIVKTGPVPPGKKRSIGTANSSGDIIAFIDDDAYPDKDWITNAVKIIDHQKVNCVCGPAILPLKSTFWEKIFNTILQNPIGSGIYMYRFKKMPARYVDDYPFVNFISKKDILKAVGDKDSTYWPGDDSKVCKRLVYELDQKIYYHPDILVYHHKRDDLNGFVKQHMNYGFNRGYFVVQGDKNSHKIQYLLPPIFLTYLIVLMTISPLYLLQINYLLIIMLIPLIMYKMGLIFLFFNSLSVTKDLKISFIAPIITFITHMAYGFAFIIGMSKCIINHGKPPKQN